MSKAGEDDTMNTVLILGCGNCVRTVCKDKDVVIERQTVNLFIFYNVIH